MTISYTLDVSKSDHRGFFRLLCRWRGSVWKAMAFQLTIWVVAYLIISIIYRFILSEEQQIVFESLAYYLNTGLDSVIPLTFMLGFFVTFVVGRWGHILNGMGYIDNSAVNFATFIRGSDTETQILRRNLVRYMVLTQALILRDISVQVRKRFPALDTLVAAGLMTKAEMDIIERIHDSYSRYWTPIHWCYSLLYEARLQGKITSDFFLDRVTHEVQNFRHGLASLLKYDWVPIPLLYPQVIFMAVRAYFFICLFSRQFIVRPGANHKSEIDLWLPITTIVQFVVYVGWMKVAEALLNPLGEDDDDLECNYIIDKNLITGLTLVTETPKWIPEQKKDPFWDEHHIAPLYSLEAASRTVHPLIGSASKINLVKNKSKVVMLPHKSKLAKMGEEDQRAHLKVVNVERHNEEFKEEERKEKHADHGALARIRKRHQNGKLSAAITSNGVATRDVLSPSPLATMTPKTSNPIEFVGSVRREPAYFASDREHDGVNTRHPSSGNIWTKQENDPSSPRYYRVPVGSGEMSRDTKVQDYRRNYLPPRDDDYSESGTLNRGLRRY